LLELHNHHFLGAKGLIVYEKSDYRQTKAIYEEGLKQFPDHPLLLNSYAFFLRENLKDFKAAEDCYKQALKKDPNNANILGSYAYFCTLFATTIGMPRTIINGLWKLTLIIK
jgi:tetratricopeptide (TPR) repeat protein